MWVEHQSVKTVIHPKIRKLSRGRPAKSPYRDLSFPGLFRRVGNKMRFRCKKRKQVLSEDLWGKGQDQVQGSTEIGASGEGAVKGKTTGA